MPIVTVTSADSVVERVAVIVIDDPAFSAIDDALTVRATVGALSFSDTVILTACVPLSVASPPDTPLMEMVAVSSPS